MGKLNIEDFIKRSNIIHNNIYDYSLVNYKNSKTKVKIICKEHGMFEQIPNNHLRGAKCLKCSTTYSSLGGKKFIEKSHTIFGDKYNYSLVEYSNNRNKVKIICKKHGIFEQIPFNHLKGKGCLKCHRQFFSDGFIYKANIIHNNIYDYSLSNYVNSKINIIIICKEHGKFSQTPNNHLSGSKCPKCQNSKGELEILKYLDNKNIEYISEKKFEDFGLKRFDFYVPKYNLCIEYDGIQHFESREFFGGENALSEQKKSDKLKNKYCIDNNIKLIRIPYWDFNNISEILDENI
jgi:hypothetical protein